MFSSVYSRPFGTFAYVCASVIGLSLQIATAVVAGAGETDADISALRGYVSSIEPAHVIPVSSDSSSGNLNPHQTAGSVHHGYSDPEYQALNDFANKLDANRAKIPTPSDSADTKIAQADNALDALREWFEKRNAPASSPAPSPARKNGPLAGGTQPSELPDNAVSVGSQVCATCHSGSNESFSKTLMGKIAKTQKGKLDCESCHGPGSAHVKAGGGRGVAIISFRPDDLTRTATQNNELCLSCHQKGAQTMWHGSTHDERGLMCTSCHTVMKNVSRKSLLKTAFQPETCGQCHQKQRSEMWRTSHMPMRTPSLGREGKMVCTDCHNPHGSYSESQLKKATVNEVCWTCHAEKRGPYLWEHQPVTENCLNCHEAHGSNNDSMLKISRPRLCQQCHSGGQHNSNPRNPSVSLYAQGRECTHCHSTHHGSNNPAGARFMR